MKDEEINYHVLMKEEQSSSSNSKGYMGAAKEYSELSEKELKLLVDQFVAALQEVMDKAALPEKDKKYRFLEGWVQALKEVNCEWFDDVSKKSRRVYVLNPTEAKPSKIEHFCEYKLIRNYERAVLDLKKDEKSSAPVCNLLEQFQNRARMNAEQLRIWAEFHYVFVRKHVELRFLVFLTNSDKDKFPKHERMRFESAYDTSLRLKAETLPLKLTSQD